MWVRNAAFLAAVLAGGSAFGQSTAYYITDGDSNRMWIVQNGALVNVAATFSLGYPIAVTNTVWLGDRDDRNAVQYDLAGNPTGFSSVGGNNFTQLLDGTTDAVMYNYGVECCGSTNSVTRANLDWTNQTALFTIPFEGVGIAYDTTDGTLYVSSFFDQTVYHYDLAGNVLGSFVSPTGAALVSLAYEMATDTLWAMHNGGSTVYQVSKTGSLLNSLNIPNFVPGNNWGGEMVMIPEPASVALLGLGLAGMGLVARRVRRSANA